MPVIPLMEVVSLAWFAGVWPGYAWSADRAVRRPDPLRAAMHGHRYVRRQRMQQRDNRVMDVNILRNLLQGVPFFASTTLLILVGLITLPGSTDKAISLVRELPFAATMSLAQWEIRLPVLAGIFVHAHFKFTWALCQFNPCSVLVGTAPVAADDDDARRAAKVSTLTLKDFNQGGWAYYFSLAALGWFVNAWIFMLATTLVKAVLYRRERPSQAMHALRFAA